MLISAQFLFSPAVLYQRLILGSEEHRANLIEIISICVCQVHLNLSIVLSSLVCSEKILKCNPLLKIKLVMRTPLSFAKINFQNKSIKMYRNRFLWNEPELKIINLRLELQFSV